jgi:hypothetical protein
MTQALTTIQPTNPLAAIVRATHLADSTKAQYKKALGNYLDTGNSLTDAEALSGYALALNPSSRAFLKSAVRLWAADLEQKLKGGANPENVDAVQAAVYRLEVLNDAIHVKKAGGQKTHT